MVLRVSEFWAEPAISSIEKIGVAFTSKKVIKYLTHIDQEHKLD